MPPSSTLDSKRHSALCLSRPWRCTKSKSRIAMLRGDMPSRSLAGLSSARPVQVVKWRDITTAACLALGICSMVLQPPRSSQFSPIALGTPPGQAISTGRCIGGEMAGAFCAGFSQSGKHKLQIHLGIHRLAAIASTSPSAEPASHQQTAGKETHQQPQTPAPPQRPIRRMRPKAGEKKPNCS